MKHISIGGLDVSRIGLGAMSMAGYYNIGAGSDAESIRTIHRALDLGVTHLDTAEIYGPYTNEELVGRAIKDRRDRVVLATKFGIVSHAAGGPGVLDSSPPCGPVAELLPRCASWASGSFPTRRLATASSPGTSARPSS